jgi:bifunctional non-homologous end joining protein LigD
MNTVMTPPVAEHTTLYYREGSSDKVYQASIEPRGELFVVNFAFGRRGTTLQTGTKTSSPVDHQTAKNTYDKLIQEKMAKGYTPGPEGTLYQHTDNEQRATGVLPQLLNPIEEHQVNQFIYDPNWCAQEKFDGRRMLLRKQGNQVQGINRKGLVVGLPESVVNAAQAVPGELVLDGECVGDRLFVFDLLQLGNLDLRQEPYQKRLVALMNLLGLAMQRRILLADTAFTQGQKRDLLNWLKRENKEGIVFKQLTAPYRPGRPASGGSALKFKFYATVSAVVSKANPQRSIELRLLNCKGWVQVGNVTIPVNHPVPEVGSVVEIRYLYAFRESKALFQPVYLGRRKDIEPHECILSQLKYKSEGEGAEE